MANDCEKDSHQILDRAWPGCHFSDDMDVDRLNAVSILQDCGLLSLGVARMRISLHLLSVTLPHQKPFIELVEKCISYPYNTLLRGFATILTIAFLFVSFMVSKKSKKSKNL